MNLLQTPTKCALNTTLGPGNAWAAISRQFLRYSTGGTTSASLAAVTRCFRRVSVSRPGPCLARGVATRGGSRTEGGPGMSQSPGRRRDESERRRAVEEFPTVSAARVLAVSDLHVDYRENMHLVSSWDNEEYRHDALIVAGDITDNMQLLKSTLTLLKSRFAHVFFVPGNHELWIRPKEAIHDSIDKFNNILTLCAEVGVHTRPVRIRLPSTTRRGRVHLNHCSIKKTPLGQAGPGQHPTPASTFSDVTRDLGDVTLQEDGGFVWVVPLLSWYSTPEDDLEESLYIAPTTWKEDPRACQQMWMDNHLCKWPPHMPGGQTLAEYFASFNEEFLDYDYGGDVVVTFSHFLPRRDLVQATPAELLGVSRARRRAGLDGVGGAPAGRRPPGGFNFTRVAGTRRLELQLRRVGAQVHVFGHQHRDRDRHVAGVRYVQHCVAGPGERRDGWVGGLHEWDGPKQVWPPA